MSNSYLLFKERLIEKRKKQLLSMQALAERAGVSKSLISKIERGQVQPSIETASYIAEGLNSSLSEMFLPEQRGAIIHYPANKQLEIKGDNYIRKIMSPSMQKACVEIFHLHLKKGAETERTSYTDADKYILALDAGLSVMADDSIYHLEKGDSIHIKKQIEHSLKNNLDKDISVITVLHRKHST